MTPSNIFDEKYFTSVNYTNYLSRYERYERLAAEIGTLMGNLSLLNKDSKCLDYGCAVGFLPKAFQKKGYPNFYGYDISDWAKSEARCNWGSNHHRPGFEIIKPVVDTGVRHVFHDIQTKRNIKINIIDVF